MTTKVEEEVRLRREEWRAVVNRGNVDAYAGLVTEDVVWLPPVGEPIRGRDAFRAWLAPFMERYDYDFHLEALRVRAFPGWCAETGTFRSVMTEKGTDRPQEHAGTYLVIWRRDEADGRWRIERYVDGLGA